MLVAPALFVVVAVALRAHWSRSGQYPLTGDEPHYLVDSRSLWVYHSLEMSKAFRDAYHRQLFYAWPSLSAAFSHLIHTSHGLYSIHDLGLPTVIGPAVMLRGATGARGVMLLFAVALPVILYLALRAEGCRVWASALFAAALSVSAPLLAFATQIYPDVPAGVIAAGMLVVILRRARLQTVERAAVRYVALAAVAFLPWLNVRVVVLTPILAGALIFMRRKPDRRAVLGEGGAIALSLLIYAAYNLGIFGSLSPIPHTTQLAATPPNVLMVFVGLNVDRFQGMFVAQPVLLFAFFGIALLFRRARDLALLTIALYLIILLSNAQHGTWGGDSLVGRYGMSAAIVLLVPAAVGLAELARRAVAAAYAVAAGVIALNAWEIARVWGGNLALQDQPAREPRSLYPSWLPLLGRSLPAVNRITWGWSFLPNYVVPAALVVLAVGCALLLTRRARAGAVIAIIAVVALLVPTASSTPTRRQDTAVLTAGNLPRQVGRVTGSVVVADPAHDAEGLLTYGPGYPMSGDSDWYTTMHYSSPAAPTVTVGNYALSIGPDPWCETLLPGTNDRMTAVTLRWRNQNAGGALALGVEYDATAPISMGTVNVVRGAPKSRSVLCVRPKPRAEHHGS